MAAAIAGAAAATTTTAATTAPAPSTATTAPAIGFHPLLSVGDGDHHVGLTLGIERKWEA